MPYDRYVETHEWYLTRKRRHEIDGGRCVACQKQVELNESQGHHLDYTRLGHEQMDDIITMCTSCHNRFHNNWKPAEYFRESDDNHWSVYSLEDTAKLCGMYLHEDYWFGGELNCCNPTVCMDLIDSYFRDCSILIPPVISPNDVQLFFRNKRYEILFEAEKNGMPLGTMNEISEAFLDEKFGKKGGKGGNPNRAEARKFMTKHTSESFHRNYWCLYQINVLVQEAKKYEQT